MPPEPGLIEFLPPDERAFGPADGVDGPGEVFVGFDGDAWDDTDDDEPASRWLPVLAGIAVVGLLAGGVVAAAPWSGDTDATPPSTTTTTPTTPTTLVAPAPLTTATAQPVDPSRTGWLLDPVPTGLTAAFFARGDDRVDDSIGWGEVWAEADATRTSGRWFSVLLEPFASWDPSTPEWFRVDVGGRNGHASVDPDGVVSLSFDAGQTDASRLVTIDAFGLGLTRMIELADSMSIVDDRPQLVDDRPSFDADLLDGLEQVAAARTDVELTTRAVLGGPPRTSAFYAGPDRFDVTIVQEQPAELDDPRLLALATTAIPLADGWGPQEDFDGEGLTVGRRTIDGFDIVVARWQEDDTAVSLLTTGDLIDLLATIPDVQFASAEDWAAAERRARNVAFPQTTEPRTPPGITIGSGTLADGPATVWSVLHWASNDELSVRVGDETYEGTLGRPTMTITPVTVGSATLLIARSTEPGSLLIRVGDADGQMFGLGATDLVAGASTDDVEQVWFGALAVDGTSIVDGTRPGSFEAQVVAVDGTVLHRFAPWEPDAGMADQEVGR
ncbi:MAG: hypothetical protein NTZ21_02210 [Actinobacteria bacterium]|nr:hypothetical protein [Actinomycetota bacterium]